jgi:ABC-type transport system substrate-binding protein
VLSITAVDQDHRGQAEGAAGLPAVLICFFTIGQVRHSAERDGQRFRCPKGHARDGAFILDKYTPSVGISWKRNPDYYDKNFPLVDQVETPFVLEYAQGLAQLKAGNLYNYAVKSEDLFTLIQDVPALKVYKIVPTTISAGDALRFGVLPDPMNKPFQDERVRQAISMSWDRDLYLDTFSGVAKLRSQGLPVDTYWNTAIGYSPGWWLDPKGKDLVPTPSISVQPDRGEQLLAAAGYAGGISVTSTLSRAGTGVDYQKTITVKDEFARQVGFKISPNPVTTTPSTSRSCAMAVATRGVDIHSGAPSAEDAVAYMVWRYYSKGAATFLGDVNGRATTQHPYVDAQVDKARAKSTREAQGAHLRPAALSWQAMYGISDPAARRSFRWHGRCLATSGLPGRFARAELQLADRRARRL